MHNVSNQLKIEDFIKIRLKDHKTISEASKNIDEFRKTYGKAEKGYNSTAIIRRMRDFRK